jgi:hypothetical protein
MHKAVKLLSDVQETTLFGALKRHGINSLEILTLKLKDFDPDATHRVMIFLNPHLELSEEDEKFIADDLKAMVAFLDKKHKPEVVEPEPEGPEEVKFASFNIKKDDKPKNRKFKSVVKSIQTLTTFKETFNKIHMAHHDTE